MGIGDIFQRTVIAQVESIAVDLSTQNWFMNGFVPDGRHKYKFNLCTRRKQGTTKTALCSLEVGTPGVKITLPWHLSKYDYTAEHLNGGLQLEGCAVSHDELLGRVAGGLFRSNLTFQDIKEAFYYPSLRVYGFKVGSEVRRMSDLDPIDIPPADREATRCFLDALESGCGKGGAEAHLHFAQGFSMTQARRFATELVKSYPLLFHRLDAGRYRLTLWGHHILKELTNCRGGDFSW